MPKSTYFRNAVLNYLGGTTITPPANVHMSLHSADPGLTGANELPTTSWTDYARLSITNNATNFPAASAGSKSWPGVALTFDASATVTGTAPVATHWGLWDASSGGNFIRGGALASSQTINNGNPVTIAINAMTSSET